MCGLFRMRWYLRVRTKENICWIQRHTSLKAKESVKFMAKFWLLAKQTSFKNNIWNSSGGGDFTSGNDGRLEVVADRLAFALDGLGERIVLEFFEQHFVSLRKSENLFSDQTWGVATKIKYFLLSWRNANKLFSLIIQSKARKDASQHVTLIWDGERKSKETQNALRNFAVKKRKENSLSEKITQMKMRVSLVI